MNNTILFTEQQRFKQWWIWLVLLGLNALFLYGLVRQVVGGQQFGNTPMSNTGLVLAAGITSALTILFLNFRLDTKITREGVAVRFFPFHIKFRHYSWESLTKSVVRQYAPIAEYGGWGLRYGFFGSGTAYTVSGDWGLQLEFKDHKKLLIGTNKPDELDEVLKKAGTLQH